MAVVGYKKVMVAVDESESSYYALKWVLENLQESISSSGNPLVIFMAEPRPNHGNTLAPLLAPARCKYMKQQLLNLLALSKNEITWCLGISEKAKSLCTSYGECKFEDRIAIQEEKDPCWTGPLEVMEGQVIKAYIVWMISWKNHGDEGQLTEATQWG
ncbi:hypothetical protein RND71_026430 [Anisodus tanguticus]|uniref:UspA domain-containing protein n=1 Tax=Anisodus tanguticus TaxID=243964 RepID=A0AAE1V8B7_9SOLA|nr:hypothetical protein RND71_026430 [Anisodus tanguticus]